MKRAEIKQKIERLNIQVESLHIVLNSVNENSNDYDYIMNNIILLNREVLSLKEELKKMGLEPITEAQVLDCFWNNNSLYNRCYIHRGVNNHLYLRFDNAIKLEHIQERFLSYCKEIGVDGSLVIIEHREFVNGFHTTPFDYVVSIPNIE